MIPLVMVFQDLFTHRGSMGLIIIQMYVPLIIIIVHLLTATIQVTIL